MSEELIQQRNKLSADHEASVELATEANQQVTDASAAIESFDAEHPEICAAFNRVIAEARAAAKPKPEPVEAEAEG